MEPEAIQNLERGYYYPLPPLANGQGATFADRRNANPNQSAESLIQPMFYTAKEHAKNENSQTKGVKVFFMLVMPNMTAINNHVRKLAFPMV